MLVKLIVSIPVSVTIISFVITLSLTANPYLSWISVTFTFVPSSIPEIVNGSLGFTVTFRIPSLSDFIVPADVTNT